VETGDGRPRVTGRERRARRSLGFGGISTTRVSSSSVDSPRTTCASPESQSDFIRPVARLRIRSAPHRRQSAARARAVMMRISRMENDRGSRSSRSRDSPRPYSAYLWDQRRTARAPHHTSLHVGHNLRSALSTTPRATGRSCTTPRRCRRVG